MKTLFGPQTDPLIAVTVVLGAVAIALDQAHHIGIQLSQAWLLGIYLVAGPYLAWQVASAITTRQTSQIWPSVNAVLRSEGRDTAGRRCASLHVNIVAPASTFVRSRDMVMLLKSLPATLNGDAAKDFEKITITSALFNEKRANQLKNDLHRYGWHVEDLGPSPMPWAARFMLSLYTFSPLAAKALYQLMGRSLQIHATQVWAQAPTPPSFQTLEVSRKPL